jgi:quaternary ammonium compound-resistance protein SugE
MAMPPPANPNTPRKTQTMPWILLAGAGLLEIVWAVALKHADGFTRLLPTTIALAAATLSFFLLSVALRDLPVGTAYAVWVGIGAFGVAITGMVMLGEHVSLARAGFLAAILIGVIGLRVVEG